MAIYADTFTDEQLAGFQDFFRIPVRQPWVEKQSEVMMWILQIWQSKVADIMPAEHGRNDERYAAGRVACSRPGYSERACLGHGHSERKMTRRVFFDFP